MAASSDAIRNSHLAKIRNLFDPDSNENAVITPSNYNTEVAMGRVPNATTWNKFGYNNDVDTAATETLWAFGGAFTPLLSASTLSFVSSSANDKIGDIGAMGLVVYGVNASRIAVIEVIMLNGTTPVITTSTWLGLNRVAVYLSGTSLSNIGNITITATTDSSVQGYLPAGESTTQQLIFFTQFGHTLLLDSIQLNAEKVGGGSAPKVLFKAWVYSAVSNTKYEVFRSFIDSSTNDHLDLTPRQPFVVDERSVIWFEATTNVNNTEVSGRFSGIELKN